MPRKPYKKSESFAHFNDEGLDELHRSDPDREFSLSEIAEAAGTHRQTIYAIEVRAMRKIRDELIRRGVYKF